MVSDSRANTITQQPTVADRDEVIERWHDAALLGGQISQTAIQKLIAYLGDEHCLVRWQAGVSLGEIGAQLRKRARLGWPTIGKQSPELTFSGLLVLLRQGLQDDDPLRRAATADALALWDHEAVVGFLIPAMQDPEPLVRVSVATALGKLRDKAAVDVLISALADPSLWVRRAAAEALGAIEDERAAAGLQRVWLDPSPLVRASAVCALGHMPNGRAREVLEKATEDQDGCVRWYAARALGRVGSMSSLPALRLLDDSFRLFDRSIGEMAEESMRAITRRERGVWHWLRKQFFALRDGVRRSPIFPAIGRGIVALAKSLGRAAARLARSVVSAAKRWLERRRAGEGR